MQSHDFTLNPDLNRIQEKFRSLLTSEPAEESELFFFFTKVNASDMKKGAIAITSIMFITSLENFNLLGLAKNLDGQ